MVSLFNCEIPQKNQSFVLSYKSRPLGKTELFINRTIKIHKKYSESNANVIMKFFYLTISKNVSGWSLSNISLHVITVTRFSVSDKLIIL